MSQFVATALINKLTSMLTQRLIEEVSVAVKFKKDFEFICDELIHIKSLLNDARDKSNSESMTVWLHKLQSFLHEAVDVVEKCDKGENSLCVNPIFRWQMGREIKELKERLSDIHGSGARYVKYLSSVLDVNARVRALDASSEDERKRNSTSQLMKEFETVNMEKDINEITQKILQDNSHRVIAIVGMGGMGKTLLVQHVFNNEDVKKKFKHRVWLSVSQVLKVEDLLQGIAEQIQLPGDELTIQLPKESHDDKIMTIQLPKDIHSTLTQVSTEGLRTRIHRYLQLDGKIGNSSGLPGRDPGSKPPAATIMERKSNYLFVLEGLRTRIHRYLQPPAATIMERKSNYLFVLDDVWDKHVLQQIGLTLDSENIKIVVTTRDKGVSHAMRADTHLMKYLSEEDSLELFCIHAFPSINHEDERKLPKGLETFGPRILEKCSRLPLAIEEIAKSMAGVSTIPNAYEKALLRLKEDRADLINKHVMPTLTSSYDALPTHLKACFLYFSSFPPNYSVKSECLVYAWIAQEIVSAAVDTEGAVVHTDGAVVDAYDVGCSFIDELVDRSVIEVSGSSADGRVKHCKMQDFFHDLALTESRKEPQCLLMPGQELKELPKLSKYRAARRISLVKNDIPPIKKAIQCPRLRTLLLCDNTKLTSISAGFFNNLRYLAVLDLSETAITSLPNSIRKLEGLKFLNLSGTKIKKLSRSLSGLQNLLFLDVSRCQDLRKLHSGIEEHKSLMHLNVKGCKNLESLPPGISKLHSLRTLKLKGLVSNRKATANAFGSEDIKDLTLLQHLSISFNKDSIFKGFLSTQTWKSLKKMRNLSLQYDDSLGPLKINMSDRSESLPHCCPVPRGLELMTHLEILRLSKCRLLVPRPDWLFQLDNLMVLVLDGDDSTSADHYKGLETICNLKKLQLSSNQKCDGFPIEFGEPTAFPKLEEFIIQDFECLENFPLLRKNTMPLLKHFKIKNCRQLKDVPRGLESIRSLRKLCLCGNEKCNKFPEEYGKPEAFSKLEELIIEDFECLENFPSLQKNAMPVLKSLGIINCSQLKDISRELDSLNNLEQLQLELDKRLEEIILKGHKPEILNAVKYKITRVNIEEEKSSEAGPSLNEPVLDYLNEPVLDYFEV